MLMWWKAQNETYFVQSMPGAFVNWGWLVRNTAVGIGFTFVMLAVIYFAARLLFWQL